MIVFNQLNPIVDAIVAPCDEPTLHIEKEDNNMFNVGTFVEESSQTFIVIELSLF
jgi:hypothetical protein